jgi:hypothetical protein
LLGLRRACTGNDGRLERCDQCSFDLRDAVPKGHPIDSRKLQEILDIQLRSPKSIAERPKGEYFAVLRHLIDLLIGDGTGLKDLRSVVASRSRIPRVDAERHYEPDFETASFEEMNADARELALKAALWLIDRWPDRFLRCCKEANTRSPILNRGAVSVRWFNAAVKLAYDRPG